MKNLKNKFAKTLITFSVLFVLASCKKDKDAENERGNIDFTKYYITGEYVTNGMSSSYAYVFGALVKSNLLAAGGKISESGSYAYADGTLTINQTNTFSIANGSVTGNNNPDIKTYYLQKIPDTDAFAGKTFRGTAATNGVDIGKSCLIKFTTAKTFSVSIDGFGQTGTGADYTLQNNGVATANTGNEGKLHLMTMANGKLYYSQYNAANNIHYYGFLTQQ